jgi:transcriptional regulator with XRE-family HTH domain
LPFIFFSPWGLKMLALRLARILRHRPIYVLARRAGMSASRLSLLERGFVPATDAEHAQLAACLAVPEGILFAEVQVEDIFQVSGARSHPPGGWH